MPLRLKQKMFSFFHGGDFGNLKQLEKCHLENHLPFWFFI